MKPIPYHSESPLQKPMEAFFVLLTGGVLYFGLEVLLRGFSHLSMAVCGAICFWFMYRLSRRRPDLSLLSRALLSTLFITTVELIAGCILNLELELNLWDYSDLHYHLLGQICLSQSAVWFLLSFPAFGLCRLIRKEVFLCDV